jgi:hypothetical protein
MPWKGCGGDHRNELALEFDMERDLDKLTKQALVAVVLCTGALFICFGFLVNLRFL